MPYETGTAAGHIDLVERIRKFATGYGVAGTPAYTGTGNGVLDHVDTDETSVTETWTITCTVAATDAGTFSVVGSVSGAQADAEVGTAYDNGLISFLINDGSTDFIVNDFFTIAVTEGAMKTAGEAWILDSLIEGRRIDHFSSSEYAGYPVENIFNGIKNTLEGWRSANGAVTNSHVGLELIETIAVGEISITCMNNATYAPVDFTIQYSDDGLTYYDAVVITGETGWGEYETRHYSTTLGATDKHKYWRLYIQASGSASYVDLAELELWEVGDSGRTYNLARQVSEEVIMHGEGLAGTDAIYVGLKPFKGDADAYNLELRGFTGYSASQDFEGQPGISPPAYSLLYNTSIPYWIVASGRRVIVVAKISTVYEAFCFGFMLPYATPAQYPYPLFVGGSAEASDLRWSDATRDHAHFTNPGNNGSYLRDVNGAWLVFENETQSGSTVSIKTTNNTLPYGGGSYTDDGLALIRTTQDGAYALLPINLISQSPDPNVYGELDGAHYVTGFGNAAENIITIGGIDYLVVQNVHRTAAGDYWALKLE